MHVRALASAAALAGVAAALDAYMTLPELGLARRDGGLAYQPKLTACKSGNSCAEACGPGYEQCAVGAGSADNAHCYNRLQNETCCMDGSGHSCAAGFYCTRDGSKKNFCCPDGSSLADCAAKHGVVGELRAATSAPAAPSSTPPPPPATSSPASSTPAPSSAPVLPLSLNTTTVAEVVTVRPTSSAYSTPWAALNTTVTTALPSLAPYATSQVPANATGIRVSAAAATRASSALLLLVAGVVSLL